MRRSLAIIWDCLTCLLAACPLVVLIAPPAYAYVDPSVMTYTIQAIAGVAVALSAVLGVALRRTRNVIFRVFKIDENANKVVEEPVVAIDAHGPEAALERSHAEETARTDALFLEKGPEPKRLGWPMRFVRALLCCGFLIFTVFVMAPLEVVSASGESLNFGFLDVAPYVIVVGAAFMVVVALLLSFVRGRAFDVLMTVVVALGLCACVQALFLNESLPIADGRELSLADHKTITTISTIAWIAIIAGFLVLNAKKKQVCRALALTLSACLILVQGISLGSIAIDAQRASEEGSAALVQTTQGLYDVSADDNVIVFILDFFDTQNLESILDDDPQALAEFTGFTFFRNSAGSMIPTAYAIPYLLTGQLPQDGDSFESYMTARYERSDFLPKIAEAGYDIGIYSDSVESAIPAAFASNYVMPGSLEINAPALIGVLDKVALYRDLPWILKPLLWFYTDEVNRAALSEEQSPYVMDDLQYAETLRNDGLEVNDAGKAFRFIHLLGAHYPFVMDADGNAAENPTDIKTQGHGSLMVVSDYLRELKRLGLYDEATIIVTSDHGNWYLTDQTIETPVSPILLVKPAETATEAAEPVRISNVPTGHLDFHGTIMDAIGSDAHEYGPTVFEIEDGERPRYYWMTGNDGTGSIFWRQFEIDGDVLDFDAWKLTGEEIEIPRQ